VNTHEHIDELAELYALGVLDDAERTSVDAHVRSCDLCARRIGEAEALIADSIQEREPPSSLDVRVRKAFAPPARVAPRWGALVAAAFVIGLLPGMLFAVFNRPAAPYQADRDRAIAAMVNSHFLHAQFTALAPDAPKAKVLYGRSTPWRYFVAQTNRAYTIEAQNLNGASVVGTLHVAGNSGELFVPQSSARSFVLLDGTRPVARVKLP
jgi:anti-sigma-K factor RskA